MNNKQHCGISNLLWHGVSKIEKGERKVLVTRKKPQTNIITQLKRIQKVDNMLDKMRIRSSVTTILLRLEIIPLIIAWRKRVGEQEAQRISNESAGLGTKVHNALEKYILQEEYEIKGNNVNPCYG